MITIAEAIAEGAQRLRQGSVDEERRTAGILLGHTLGVDRVYILTRTDEQIGSDQYELYLALIDRRSEGEPLQYLTGHQEFYGLDFKVTTDVLIPRPETEFLVERIIELTRAVEAPVIADIGTGSGCIAVSVAVNVPNARVTATDISGAALSVANDNAQTHNVKGRIEFLEGDLLGPLALRGLEGKMDVLASNPPYVPIEISENLQREVRDWEPEVALYGGRGGLDFYRRLLAESTIYLRPGGFLVCEIGYSQVDDIREMVEAEIWDLVDITPDLQGIPRVMSFRKVF